MEESSTYQYILRRGYARGELLALRWAILGQGQRKFGTPCKDQSKYLEALADRDRLWELIDRILDATSWNELLA